MSDSREGSDTSDQASRDHDAGAGVLTVANLPAPEVISDQLKFPEGPVWSPKESVLYYTDITADGVYRLTLPDQVDVMLMDAGHPDGLALDPDGSVVVAGYSGRSVWRLRDGAKETIVDQFDGKALNSPDDLVIRSDGTIYFTDPTFGLDYTKGEKSESGIEAVFRITPDGQTVLEDDSLSGPNGIALSPDESLLYVSSTFTGAITAYDVGEDGSLSNSRTWVSGALGADSMTVDASGNVYVATLAGISVFSSDGTSLGAIAVPQATSNVSFGGPDQRTLFITARDFLSAFGAGNAGGTLYRIDGMPVRGLPGRP